MPPKRKKPKTTAPAPAPTRKTKKSTVAEASRSDGHLVSCDIPTKQFIVYQNERLTVDKRFILQDLDATHLLVKSSAVPEVQRAMEKFFDDNCYQNMGRLGEDFDTS